MPLVLGDLGEDRQLLGLLEAAEPDGGRARLWRDGDNRRVRPVSRRYRCHEIRDAGAVLPDAYAMAATNAGITIGHVRGSLFMHGRNKTDTGRREDVEGIHVS